MESRSDSEPDLDVLCVAEIMAYLLAQRTVPNGFLPLFSTSMVTTSVSSCFLRREFVSFLGAHIQRAPEFVYVSSFCAPKLQSRNFHSSVQNSMTSIHAQPASAQTPGDTAEGLITVMVDSSADKGTTDIEIVAPNWPGILASITEEFKVLELEVVESAIDLKDGHVLYKFSVQDIRIDAHANFEDFKNVEKALRRVLNPSLWSDLGKNVNLCHSIGDPETQRRRRLLWLMDQYLNNDVPSIQKSIVDHVEYTIARSRFKFDDFEAYKVLIYF